MANCVISMEKFEHGWEDIFKLSSIQNNMISYDFINKKSVLNILIEIKAQV